MLSMIRMLRKLDGKRKYAFKEYNPAYAKLFERERRRLVRALGPGCHIEHVGSTAVDGLGGKNILDIMVGIEHGWPYALAARIERLGYTFMQQSGSTERLFFARDTTRNRLHVRIHLHLTMSMGREWREKVAFRDYLRGNREAMLKYAEVKRRAAGLAHGSKERYMAEKAAFINATTSKALLRARRRGMSRPHKRL